MADLNKIVSSMQKSVGCVEKLCEVEAFQKWYKKKFIRDFKPCSSKKFRNVELEAKEQIVSLVYERFTTNVPVLEAIEFILRCLYSKFNPLKFERLSF